MHQHSFRLYFILVLSMVLWSYTFIWYKEVFIYLQPMTTIFLRLIIASVILLIFNYLTGKLQKIKTEDYGLLILMAFFEPFIYFIGESFGMSKVSSTIGAVIISTIPVFTPVISRFLFSEKLGFLNLAGIAVSFAGVIIVVIKKDLSFAADPAGIALLFVAVAGALGYTAIIYRFTKKYNPFTLVTIQNTFGVFWFLPFVFIIEGNPFAALKPDMNMLLPLFNLAFFGSSMAFLLFIYGIKHLGPTRANMFSNIIPVSTALISALWYGEIITLQMAVGIFIVVTGLFMSQLKRKPATI